MSYKTLSLALSLAIIPGCIVVDDGHSPSSNPGNGGGAGVANTAPSVDWASSGCYWDSYYYDDVWYFEADVYDADSIWDVSAVYADVYDSWTGEWVDSFELYETQDPYVWFSDWLGSSTYLDCYYSGYEVDIIVYDSFEAYDVMTVYPETYGYY
jgi:hypothetical protein